MKSKSQASSSHPNSIISPPIIPPLSDVGALEARLESLAKQTHLRRRDLKRILRTLVTDSDVLDLLAGLCAEPDEPSPKNSRLSRFEPKLTRYLFISGKLLVFIYEFNLLLFICF